MLGARPGLGDAVPVWRGRWRFQSAVVLWALARWSDRLPLSAVSAAPPPVGCPRKPQGRKALRHPLLKPDAADSFVQRSGFLIYLLFAAPGISCRHAYIACSTLLGGLTNRQLRGWLRHKLFPHF